MEKDPNLVQNLIGAGRELKSLFPILTYGSEVWGVDHDGKLENDPIEFVQTNFIRWLLGVNKFCSSNAWRSEVGCFPMRTKTVQSH